VEERECIRINPNKSEGLCIPQKETANVLMIGVNECVGQRRRGISSVFINIL